MTAIITAWDTEQDNLYIVKCNTGWTWKQFVDTIDETYAMIGGLDQTVNFAMWFKILPPGDIRQPMTHAGGTQPPNIRHTVIISEVSRFLELVVRKEDRQQGWTGPKIVQTLEQARAYLAAIDQ